MKNQKRCTNCGYLAIDKKELSCPVCGSSMVRVKNSAISQIKEVEDVGKNQKRLNKEDRKVVNEIFFNPDEVDEEAAKMVINKIVDGQPAIKIRASINTSPFAASLYGFLASVFLGPFSLAVVIALLAKAPDVIYKRLSKDNSGLEEFQKKRKRFTVWFSVGAVVALLIDIAIAFYTYKAKF